MESDARGSRAVRAAVPDGCAIRGRVPKPVMDFFEKRAGMPTAGLLGSDMLLGYRVGLDYAHSTVYFDIGRCTSFRTLT